MRALALGLIITAGCSGSPQQLLPAADGWGPLGGTNPAPTSTGTTPPAASSTPPPASPPPPQDAGVDAGAIGPGGNEGGTQEAGTLPDSGAGVLEGGGSDAGTVSALLSLCVSEINQLRNQNGAQPYTESPQLEAFAAQAAASDAQSGQQDGYFNQTNGGNVASTENEYDGAQIHPGGSAQQVLDQGLQNDQQGQSGGFGNLVAGQFSQVGCGFAQDASGNWWVDIAFQ